MPEESTAPAAPTFKFEGLDEQAAGAMDRAPDPSANSATVVARELAELGVGNDANNAAASTVDTTERGGASSSTTSAIGRQVHANEGKTDARGTAFDSSIHTGTVLKDGTWRKKKGPRTTAPASTAVISAQPVVKPFNPAAARAAALMATNAHFSFCRLFGREFKPDPDEFDNVRNAMEAYFIAKQIDDFPPGIALGIAMGGHFFARLQSPQKYPETAQKVRGLKLWIGIRVARWKLRKELKKQGLDPKRAKIKDGDLYIDDVRIDVEKAMEEAAAKFKD